MSISFLANGTKPTGAQWTVNYSSTDFSSVTVAQTSLVSSVSGELFSCPAGASSATCLIINMGSNTVLVPNGTIAVATFHISPTTTSSSSQITLSGLSSTDGSGNNLGLIGTGTTITINQPVAPVLSSLSCTPGTLTPPGASTCTVTLSDAATSNTNVAVSSNNGSVTVPSPVTILSGATSANFTANAPAAMSANGSALLTATLGATSKTFTLTVNAPPPPVLSSLSCTPGTLTPPGASTCTVTLSGAVTSNTNVAVSSNNGAVTVPSPVTILSGATSANFTANAPAAVSANGSALLTATLGATSKTFTLTLNAPPPPVLSSLTCTPGTLTPPGASTCTVTLSGAVTSNTNVAVSSNNGAVTVPSPVTILSGATSANFTANAPAALSANGSALLTATLGATSKTFTLTLNAPPPPVLSSLSCTPGTLTPPGASTCTVTLSGAATSNTNVAVSSNNGSVTVPSPVTILSGATSASFTANAPAAVSANGSALLTATLGTTSKTFTLSLTAGQGAGDFALSSSPGSQILGGGSSTSYALTVTPTKGFSGVVSWTVSGLPTGASTSFNPSSISGSGATVMTINTTGTTPAGTYAVAITGGSGALSHTTSVSLSIFTLTASPSLASAGGPLTISWQVPTGQAANDWIGLYPSGTANLAGWQYTNGASAGTFTLAAPAQPGQYEFRYFQRGGNTVVAVSNIVTVGLSGTYIVTPTPTNAVGLQPLTVTWAVPAGRPTTDWVGLFAAGAPNNTYAWWQYTNGAASGSVTLDAPSQPGQYEFRYLQSNNLVAARSETINIGAAPYTLNASAVSAGSVTVNWAVPSGRPSTDWIGLFAVGASNHTNVGWEYTNGAASGSFNLTAPTQAGLYEFRYLLQDGYSSVAASNSVSVGISGTYTVTVLPARINPLGTVVITWSAPAGSASNDWIGLFAVGSPNNGILWWQYTAGAAIGTVSIAMPAQAGQYELRYFQNGGYTVASRSDILTVTSTP